MNEKPRITKIPVRGGSGNVPTGAIQFEDDWPGLFLRGDAAGSLAANIRGLEQRLGHHSDPVVLAVLAQLQEIADVIERDVLVH